MSEIRCMQCGIVGLFYEGETKLPTYKARCCPSCYIGNTKFANQIKPWNKGDHIIIFHEFYQTGSGSQQNDNIMLQKRKEFIDFMYADYEFQE